MTVPIDDFRVNGFLVLRGAVAPDTVRACLTVIEKELRTREIDLRDPGTWRQPVVRIPCPEDDAFVGDGDEVVRQALDSTGGFALVLSGAKAFLEHNINLNLIADRFPEGHG